MSKGFERSFTVAVPVERAWQAFTDSHERSQWEAETYDIDPTPGGRFHWSLPGGIESEGEVLEVVPHAFLRQVEGTGPHAHAEITVTFEVVTEGTRITITHAGFGDGEQWDEWLEGTSIGWTQAIADLFAYLTTGVAARRFATLMHSPGMRMHDTDAGVEVTTIASGNLADQAGVQPGDLLLRLAGVPVFTITDVWVLMRQHQPGATLSVEYVRAGERREGTGVLAGGWDPSGEGST